MGGRGQRKQDGGGSVSSGRRDQYCPPIIPGKPACPSQAAGRLWGMLLSFLLGGFGLLLSDSQETRPKTTSAIKRTRRKAMAGLTWEKGITARSRRSPCRRAA